MVASRAFDASELALAMRPLLGSAASGRVLEWACGPGLLAERLAPGARQYVGVDVTRAMLDLAAERGAPARFLQTDVETLPFPDASFDAAISRLAVHHLESPERALAEMARVLRPGGVALIADIEGCADPEDARLHDALETLRDPTHVRLLPGEELVSLLGSVGLFVRTLERFERDRRFGDWASLVGDPSRTRPLEVVMRHLARAGCDAGIRLREESGEIRFLHRWQLLAAKRGA
ncbi:MAG: class I SAM-dependent methyltransferase [Myxococcota bacterium]|nr:class I SAM-dependent methyltransferase [Myxococcota bacterium]